MKNSIKYLSLILTIIFFIVGTAAIAYADAGDGGDSGYVDDGSGDSGSDDSGDSGIIDPGYDGGDDDPGYIDPGYDGGDDDSGYVDPGYDSGGSSYDSGSDDYSYDSSSQTYYDEDPIYYGDASNYDYNTSGDNDRDAGSVDTQLYDAKVDTSDNIKAQKWENVEVPGNNLKVNSGSTGGDVSFKTMKANTGSGDDMAWVPYLGMVLIALAVLGILYFIVATVSQRSVKGQPAKVNADNVRGAETRIASADEFKRENLRNSKKRRSDDYADGYSPASRRGAKADTGEIRLPRRFK